MNERATDQPFCSIGNYNVQPRDDFLVHETALTQLYAKET
jgi:hypothetical protein